jgi:site-specific DNA-methyltransferase (adenine-specific)
MLTATSVEHLAKGVEFHPGDSRYVLKTIPDCSIASIVTDPPYSLVSIVKRFGGANAAPAKGNEAYMRASAGFMGKQWDTGETAFSVEFWAECLRVLKPGGHVVAFGGTRTHHRLTCAIEDAGFEIRDTLGFLFGTGFPKSHDISKGIDRAAGVERQIVSQGAAVKRMIPGADQNKSGWEKNNGREYVPTVTSAATDAAIRWQGFGTALKPAMELIALARKPLIGTVAQNVLLHGTGAINIDGCRVESADNPMSWETPRGGIWATGSTATAERKQSNKGRWPANVILDGSEEVVAAFPDLHGAGSQRDEPGGGEFKSDNGWGGVGAGLKGFRIGDSGSAARFFYTAKADADDRLGSKHPTVKPVDLMQWLCRLVTPPGGTILDPFAGTGTTGEAAFREGFNAVLIEAEAEYQADIRRRMALVLAGPDERSRESIKAKNLPRDDGPLFAGLTP